MTTIATDFGYGTITGNLPQMDASVGYFVDDDNNFMVWTVAGTVTYWGFNGAFAGEQIATGFIPVPPDETEPFPGPSIKIEIVNVGHRRAIRVSGGDSPSTTTLLFTVPAYGMPETVTWTQEGGSGYSATVDTTTYNAATPCVNDATWYAKQLEDVQDGAYRRVTILAADGSVAETYSNGDDGGDALISVDVTEFFDHTTTKPQINSARFSIHVPFDKNTSQADISAFVAGFAKNTAFQIEGGWKTTTDGVESYDTTSMGYFFVTSAKLDKDAWVLEVEGHDGFGRLSESSFPDFLAADLPLTAQQGFWDITQNMNAATALAGVLSTVPTNPQLTNNDLFLTVDTALGDVLFLAPLQADVTSLDLLQQFTNLSGGRWYLTHDGHKTLELETVANLDYKISPLMTFGAPQAEEYEQPITPYRVAAYRYSQNYDSLGVPEVVCEIPRVSGLDDLGNPKDITISHSGAWSKTVYGLSGESETEITGIIDPETEHLYNTVVPASAWFMSESALYDTVVVKGLLLTESKSDTGTTTTGSSVENPLVTRGQDQNAVLLWSFPDNDGRAYTWSMRDDPSLKCGNVVQLAVDNEYLNVLLIEAKRSFNGAGRMECKAVYVSDTNEIVFETTVGSPTGGWDTGSLLKLVAPAGSTLRNAKATYTAGVTITDYLEIDIYDDASDTTHRWYTSLANGAAAFGVFPSSSTTHYCVGLSVAATDIPRTTGWHRFRYEAGRVLIDGVEARTGSYTLGAKTLFCQANASTETSGVGQFTRLVVDGVLICDFSSLTPFTLSGSTGYAATIETTPTPTDATLSIDWTAPAGYDDWPNVDLDYLIYNTTADPDVLLATEPYGDTAYEGTQVYDADATFAIAVRVDNFEYAQVAIS